MADSLTRTFAKYVCPLTYADLPAAVVDKIKASLLHALIVSIVGADTSHGKAAIALTKEEESKADGATIQRARIPSHFSFNFLLCRFIIIFINCFAI